MAIDFSLNLEGKTLNKDNIIKAVWPLVKITENDIIINSERMVFNSTYDTLGFVITLIEEYIGNYNLIETRFLCNDFEFNQLLMFEFNKEFELISSYKNAIKIIFNLMANIDTRALLSTSTFVDLCFFSGNKKLIINSKSEIMNDNDIKDGLILWDVKSVDL